MNEHDIQMIVDCLPKGKTRFYYYKDRYAQMLLSYIIGKGAKIRQLRQTHYGKLLNREIIRSVIGKAGDGELTPALLHSVWPQEYECYLLTLGQWGRSGKWIRPWYQTTRGGFNLVLQLNFSSRHNRAYHQLVQPQDHEPFECSTHPVAGDGYHTLAWSRIDVDLDKGQALIEEIQNDWLRKAVRMKGYILWWFERRRNRLWQDSYVARSVNGSPKEIIRYVDEIISGYIDVWAEVMMTATIWFLKEELGIQTIFYHTFETGNFLKGLSGYWGQPPRSLYTRLPEKFCFEKTQAGPDWLRTEPRSRTRSLTKAGNVSFWRLAF